VPGPAASLIRSLARARRRRLAAGLLALLAVDLLQLLVPRLIKQAVDGLTLGLATPGQLARLGGGILGLAAAMMLLRMLWRPLLMGFARLVERELRLRLFDHLQSLYPGYLDHHPPGELMARLTNDLNNIRMATGMGLVAAVDGVFMGLLAVGFMVWISPLLTLLACLPMPAVVWLTRLQSRRMHNGFRRVQESFAELTELVREGLSGIRLVKVYGLAGTQLARLAARGRRHLELNLELARVLGLFFPLMVLFTNLSLALVLGLGGPMTAFGRISPGDFVAFSAYLGMLAWPMMALGWVVSLLQRARSSLRRVDEVFLARPEVQPAARPRPLVPRGRGLEVRGLTYAYPGAERPVLRGVSLCVPAQGTVALVGRVAAGKSTLLQLIARLREPPPGTVWLEGVELRELELGQLRRWLLMVTQEPYLFSATVRANLCPAGEEIPEPRLWQALEAAELAAEIRALPQGLDTLLGERGMSLSGGQRQRLCLARALLREPHLLILDDPLSAVDTATEARILAHLAARRKGKANLIVSHRLASVAGAQRIYVLEEGRVVEEGTHAQLMAAGGVYHALFAEQALLAGREE